MNVRNSSVLVTGGAGFIGSNLTLELINRGCKVFVLDSMPQEHISRTLPDSGFEYVYGDIRDGDVVNSIFDEGIDFVFHLAASFANERSIKYPLQDMRVNIEGTLNLLYRAANNSNIKRFVYASSSCVQGNAEKGILTESMIPNPETPYGVSKLAGEYYTLTFSKQYDLPATAIRYFNVYGPNEYPGFYRNVIPRFFNLAAKGEPLPITGTGEETRDFTYVSDAVSGTILLAEHEGSVGKVFNVGAGAEVRVKELAEKINFLTGNKAGIKLFPRRNWDTILRRCADISRIKSLGYSPKVSLDEGLKLTYDWFKRKVVV